MTERGRATLRQDADHIAVGPSSMRWRGDRLEIVVDERAAPPQLGALRGTVTVTPARITGVELPLEPDGAHVWRPFAPDCEIEVDLGANGWRWRGHGYFDANFGTRALEADFSGWSWARFPVGGGTTCIYEARGRDGGETVHGLHFGTDGGDHAVALPPPAPLPRSAWALPRSTRADPGRTPRQVLAMLDAPFYCRSAVRTWLGGEETTGVHEALNLDRFRRPWLKPMLALRVPRRGLWRGLWRG